MSKKNTYKGTFLDLQLYNLSSWKECQNMYIKLCDISQRVKRTYTKEQNNTNQI